MQPTWLQLVLAFGAGIGALWAAIQIRGALAARQNLNCTLRINDFRLPPHIAAVFAEPSEFVLTYQVEKELIALSSKPSTESESRIAAAAVKLIVDKLAKARENSYFSSTRNFWELSIANKGSRVAEEVAVSTPGVRTVTIDVPGQPLRVMQGQSQDDFRRIVVGDLSPDVTVVLCFWSESSTGARLGASFGVSHRHGRASVRHKSTTSPVFVWLSEHWYVVLLLILIFGSMAAAVLSGDSGEQ
jgi:hypothetical protein